MRKNGRTRRYIRCLSLFMAAVLGLLLTPKQLQMAKEQNFNLILDMGNYAKWSIDVDAVNMNAVTDVDMGITLQTVIEALM